MKTILTVLALVALVIAAGMIAIDGWQLADESEMGFHGWLALGLGVGLTVLVGGGLMALVFYSARHGHDEGPEITATDENGECE